MGMITPLQVSLAERQYYKPKKISGKPHDRQSELRAYRENLDFANDKLIECALIPDSEGIELWNKIIDNAQAKITEIIKQEDTHSYQQYGHYNDIGNTAMKAADKAVDIGGRIMKISAAANIGSQIASSGPQINAVA